MTARDEPTLPPSDRCLCDLSLDDLSVLVSDAIKLVDQVFDLGVGRGDIKFDALKL
jgi:hypothetical protein